MGCNNSKQEVATGNIITRRLLRRESGAAKSKESSSNTTEVSSNNVTQVDAGEVNYDGNESAGKSFVSAIGSRGEGELIMKELETSDENSSSEQDTESLEVIPASEGADSCFQNEESEANSVEKEVEENNVVETEENENAGEAKEIIIDDGESIGQHSVDFKETSPVLEEVEGDTNINKNTEEIEIV